MKLDKRKAAQTIVEDRRGESMSMTVEKFMPLARDYRHRKMRGLSGHLDVETPFSRATEEGLKKWMRRRGGMRGRREGH